MLQILVIEKPLLNIMKKIALLIFLVSITTIVFGHESTQNTSKTITQSGIGLGSIIAVVASWDRNKSVFWAVISGLLSWVYVIYYLFSRQG